MVEEAQPANRVSRLEDHLGYWLRRVSNRISGEFAALLAEREITVAEWVVLRELFDRPDATPGLLAEWSGLTRGAMSKVIAKLERKGLVCRQANPSDGRSQEVRLTDAGQALVPVLAGLADRNDARFFGALPSEERRRLRRLLETLAAAHSLDDVPVD